jgi:pimeloyl-ACP methyl ester carboxylesterase
MRRIAFSLLTLVVLLGGTLAFVFFVYPGTVLDVVAKSARDTAGLERKTITIGDHEVVYLDGGSGPPVVLLHGFGSDKDLWNAVAARLTPSYRVIVPDLPGFGESTKLESANYDVKSQVRRLHEFLNKLGIHQTHIAGNSMGGMISVVFAAMYPEGINSLMIGAAPGAGPSAQADIEELLSSGDNPLLVGDEGDFDRMMELAFSSPPSIPGPLKREMAARAIRDQKFNAKIFDDLLSDWSIDRYLDEISVPTLIVWGADDRIVDPSAVARFSGGITSSQSVIFDDCGHALPRDCPDALVKRYLVFLTAEP